MVLPQAMVWVQYWFRVLSLKFCRKSKKICGDISQVSPAFCIYGLRFLKISQCLCFFRFLANVLSALLNLHWGGSSASLMLTRMRYHEFYAVQRRLFRKLFASEDSTLQVQKFRIPKQDAHHNVIYMVLHDSQKEGNSLREGSPSGDASPWLSRSSAAL